MRPKTITLAIVGAIAMAGLFGPGRQPSSGQITGREAPCGCYCEGTSGHAMNDYTVFNKEPCTGIVGSSGCRAYLASSPKEEVDRVCKWVRDRPGFTSYKDSCPTFASLCPEEKLPPDTKCEPPAPPWFGPSSDCKDVQEAQITQDRRGVIVYLCGYAIFRYRDEDIPSDKLFTEAYKAALRDAFKANMGKVCCNSFRQAARTGIPCNARADVDCDGKPNQTDVGKNGIPNFEGRGVRVPDDSSFYDPFPDGMTDDEIAPPPSECKDCKWVLMSGVLKCSPDGLQRHVYQARWYCPSTKVKVNIFHSGPATAPCTPPKRATTAPTLRPTSSQILGSGLLTDPSVAVLPGFWTKPRIGLQLGSNL